MKEPKTEMQFRALFFPKKLLKNKQKFSRKYFSKQYNLYNMSENSFVFWEYCIKYSGMLEFN